MKKLTLHPQLHCGGTLASFFEPLISESEKSLKENLKKFCLSQEDIDFFLNENKKTLLKERKRAVFLFELAGEVFALIYNFSPNTPGDPILFIRTANDNQLILGHDSYHLVVDEEQLLAAAH